MLLLFMTTLVLLGFTLLDKNMRFYLFFKSFIVPLELNLASLKVIRSNRGGEYMSAELPFFVKQNRIIQKKIMSAYPTTK